MRNDAQKITVEDWLEKANVKWIVGVYNVEDFLLLPDTHWIIGSGLNVYAAGFKDQVLTQQYLHLFDADAETGRSIMPDEITIKADLATYPGSTPPDWNTFGPHGLDLSNRVGDVVKLFVINHGGREAVEIFEINVAGSEPKLTWVGNLNVPEDGWPDAVCWLPDTGGVIVSAMSDPRDPIGQTKKQLTGKPVGWIKEWNPETKKWTKLAGTESLSSPNGITTNKDGSKIWINESTGACVTRINRGGSDPGLIRVPLPGAPDNLRWSADGKSIYACVHTIDGGSFEYEQIASAKWGTPIHTPFAVFKVDPETLDTETFMPAGKYGPLGATCSVIEYGNRIWAGSCMSDRMGVFDNIRDQYQD